MTQLEKTRERIDELLGARDKANADASVRFAMKEDSIKKYIAEMDLASKSRDASAFEKAKAAHDIAVLDLHAMQEYENRRKLLPIISEREYAALVADTTEECRAYVSESKRKLLALVAQIETIGSETSATITETNRVLARLQRDVYQNRDRVRVNAKGRDVIVPGGEKVFRDHSVQNFSNRVAGDFSISEWKKEFAGA